MKITVVNWTGDSNHFGCQLVGRAFRELLAGHDLETVPLGHQWTKPVYRKLVDKADLVIVNGEGSLHHNRHQGLIEVGAVAKRAWLVNTVWDHYSSVGLENFERISCRESLSADSMNAEAEVVPDVALLSMLKVAREYHGTPRKKPLLVTDGVRNKGHGKPANMTPEAYFRWLSTGERVCTGRFHGALACVALGTPFTAYPSNTHKIRGLCLDLGHPDSYAPDPDTAETHPPVPVAALRDYVADGILSIRAFWKELSLPIRR